MIQLCKPTLLNNVDPIFFPTGLNVLKQLFLTLYTRGTELAPILLNFGTGSYNFSQKICSHHTLTANTHVPV